tara:strand:+ start:765 stop:959 length:195 start_codon:yes stop_codon:yes gene_type:complete
MNDPQKLTYENNQIRLCKKGSCCPSIAKVDDDKISITDDDDNKVTLTFEQAHLVKEALAVLENV